jgi:hypothetical protein
MTDLLAQGSLAFIKMGRGGKKKTLFNIPIDIYQEKLNKSSYLYRRK